ncbi:hypothetical protein KVR01_008449 [Diaporthe batatas]|uniref:uncharacterized protein n=1 Tax=Diaporthe batatas TaxID=748121 RepID=UPI001D041D8C|nr:uncharacterized protein KVR01_008449 [Diaporthe batatas]KAG8161462.1 hypothetical protein KVR01_008449 [Diaporthe batatas]
MNPPLDDHVLQARNLHERYQLSDKVVDLFRVYGEHHRGVESRGTMGRRLRTSTLMRTCTDTISSLALAMQNNPTPECMAECNEIIACCTEMLNIANESSQDKAFPFMKLPQEIRQMVYKYYFQNLTQELPWAQTKIVLRYPVGCGCDTNNLKSYKKGEVIPLEMPLIFTCSQIKDEALEVWFHDHIFTFGCSCELTHYLQINKSMKYYLRGVKVHWRGEKSDSAFKLLQEAPRLNRLVVVISRSTSNIKSAREMLLRRYWPNRRQTCLTDALGFDELAQLVTEGRQISVEHVERTTSLRRSDQEWSSLSKLLSDLSGGIKLEEPQDGRAEWVKRRAALAAAAAAAAAADDDDDDQVKYI